MITDPAYELANRNFRFFPYLQRSNGDHHRGSQREVDPLQIREKKSAPLVGL